MAFEQTKPVINKEGLYWVSYQQVYFNSVTSGELDNGLSNTLDVQATENNCSGGTDTRFSVNEDLFGTNAGAPAWLSGKFTVTGGSGDYFSVRSVGHQ